MEERRWHKAYDEGVPPSLMYEELTLPEMLDSAAARFGHRPAITFQNATLTYSQLKNEVDRLATALAALGVAKGTRVAIQAPNLPQTVIAIFATLRAGGITVLTNPLYTGPEIEHQWNDAGATVAILMDFLYAGRVKQIRGKVGIEHYIVASIPEYLGFPLNILAPWKLKKASPPMIAKVPEAPNVHHFRKLIRRTSPNPPKLEMGMDDVAMLQYTGGTTGVSKGAMLTHRNMSFNTQQTARWATGIEEGKDTWLGCMPYFHIYGVTISMLTPVYMGGHIVLIPNPRDVGAMIKNILKHRVTLMPAVPAMYNAINQYPGVDKLDLSSIKICNSGSAPLPVEVLQRFEDLTGAKISEGFGLTETSPLTHCNPVYGMRKKGSVGVPVSDTDAKIVDIEDGVTEMPIGVEGELLIRGPQVMKGYWNRPEATDEMIKDGWLYTGDLATMDEDGYFRIVGRKKDMILCSGYNVYPDEVDRVLMGHPAVLEAATIGVPDERRGETVKSFIVLKPGAKVTSEDLVAYCRERLAAYKIPRLVEFRDSLPKSTVLKILRRELRDEEMAKLQTTG
ncbi:MAG: long-chain fatty acid--CoA ligase [Gemmatimonadetes bacterium]|nr:long-chain fatty acid--CoA ligase [Gemmatimonadota bacterium]